MKISKLSFAIRKNNSDQFVDILVDGESMYATLGINDSGMSTVLSTAFAQSSVSEFANYFDGKFMDPELKSGIAPFYVCGECGDYGCGVLGWKVEFNDKIVKWSDFQWDDNIDSEEYDSDMLDIPDLFFTQHQYADAVADMYNFYNIMSEQHER